MMDTPDLAEPSPGTERNLRVATCHHCEGTITKNHDGEWEHLALVGEPCDTFATTAIPEATP